jgi:hypothetical protein
MTSAALRLRGHDGPLRAELTWPPGDPAAVLVFIDDGHGEPACRALGDALEAVTLCVRCATEHDARVAVEWTADHAEQIGAAPAHITLAGHGTAAGITLSARDAWPALDRVILVAPRLDAGAPAGVVVVEDLAGLAAAVR